MEGLFPLLILLGIFCVLSGPAALIVGLVALSRIKQLQRERSVPTLQPLPHRQTTAAPPAAPTRPAPLEKTEPAPTAPVRPPVEVKAPATPQTLSVSNSESGRGGYLLPVW